MGNVCSTNKKTAKKRTLINNPVNENNLTFSVTNVQIPSSELETVSIKKRIADLANSKLIGGSSAYKAPNAPLITEGHPHGFIAAVTAAFKDHYPLALRPQHFWVMILQGIAVHVDQNAGKLKSKWIISKSKKKQLVDEFSYGAPNDWESVVDGKPDSFSLQIDKNTKPSVRENIVPQFSDTSIIENIAIKITIMDICKNYFEYKCSIRCGFPAITLEGTETDWKLLYIHAELVITQNCTKKFANFWLPCLIPLLKLIHEQYCAGTQGKSINDQFWNSMCKRGGTNGSGARTWFNGWFNILFPFINNQHNQYCIPYSSSMGYVQEGLVWDKKYDMFDYKPDGVQGPDCEDFPNGLGKAPVVWD